MTGGLGGIPRGIAVTTLSSALGAVPSGIAFDGQRIWTANTTGGSVSIITLNPTTVTNVSAGFSTLFGVVYDGTNIWVTDNIAGAVDKLHKLDSNGAILLSVDVGSTPLYPFFDGTNIWVPNRNSDTVSVVRATGDGRDSARHAQRQWAECSSASGLRWRADCCDERRRGQRLVVEGYGFHTDRNVLHRRGNGPSWSLRRRLELLDHASRHGQAGAVLRIFWPPRRDFRLRNQARLLRISYISSYKIPIVKVSLKIQVSKTIISACLQRMSFTMP